MSAEFTEKPFELDSQRLLVSTHLGGDFCKLLEQKDSILLEEVEILEEKLSHMEEGERVEIKVKNLEEAAFVLRIYQPEIILGSNKNILSDVVASIGSQLGVNPSSVDVNSISDRLVGREKVAIVLTSKEIVLDKKFAKLPESGILITMV